MRLIWSFHFRIRGHAIHSRHQHGLGVSFQREYFLCAGLRFVSTQQLGFSLSASPSLWHYRANATYDADFAFPPWSSLLRWVLNPWVDSGFQSAVPVTAFTTTSFTWWPGATKFISVAVLPFHLFRLSACPNWVRLSRDCLFGLRLVRAGFGYAVIVFSAFGLSELGVRPGRTQV
jgi:hypothetical protein